MKALTLRNIPYELSKLIQKKAANMHISLNQAVIKILAETIGEKQKKKTLHHDLDALAGTWTKEEASQFDRHLSKQRQIDKDLWS